MKVEMPSTPRETLGIVGFGAFGKLIAQCLSGHFQLFAHDPVSNLGDIAAQPSVSLTSLIK